MNRLMSKFAFITLAMIITLSSSLAFAQSTNTDSTDFGKRDGSARHGHFGRHGGHGGHFMMMRQLGLSDDQKAQFKQIFQSHRDATKPYREELRTRKQELHTAMQGSTYNEALVAQKLTEMASTKAKLMGEQFKIHQE